jgi:CTP synthase
MLKEALDKIVLTKLHLKSKHEPELEAWKTFLYKLKHPVTEVTIGLIGKYHELRDAYKSIYESFVHAGAVNECKVNIEPIHAESLENLDQIPDILKHLHGILIAPGFGARGIEGKYKAIEYARTRSVPFFGICLGLQSAVVEFARNVLKIPDAASTEVTPDSKNPVIDMMQEQKMITAKGGTMRLGSFDCKLKKGSAAYKIYKNEIIRERHRHRWEFNNKYADLFEAHGFQASGINPESRLVEIMELKSHPWFVGVQFHPELQSTVEKPHPLFVSFINAAIQYKAREN